MEILLGLLSLAVLKLIAGQFKLKKIVVKQGLELNDYKDFVVKHLIPSALAGSDDRINGLYKKLLRLEDMVIKLSVSKQDCKVLKKKATKKKVTKKYRVKKKAVKKKV